MEIRFGRTITFVRSSIKATHSHSVVANTRHTTHKKALTRKLKNRTTSKRKKEKPKRINNNILLCSELWFFERFCFMLGVCVCGFQSVVPLNLICNFESHTKAETFQIFCFHWIFSSHFACHVAVKSKYIIVSKANCISVKMETKASSKRERETPFCCCCSCSHYVMLFDFSIECNYTFINWIVSVLDGVKILCSSHKM